MTATCINTAPLLHHTPGQRLGQTQGQRLGHTQGQSRLPHFPPGARITRALRLAGQRRALAGLEPHMLADIGVTRAQAHRESRRPFWDAPAHWRQRT